MVLLIIHCCAQPILPVFILLIFLVHMKIINFFCKTFLLVFISLLPLSNVHLLYAGIYMPRWNIPRNFNCRIMVAVYFHLWKSIVTSIYRTFENSAHFFETNLLGWHVWDPKTWCFQKKKFSLFLSLSLTFSLFLSRNNWASTCRPTNWSVEAIKFK